MCLWGFDAVFLPVQLARSATFLSELQAGPFLVLHEPVKQGPAFFVFFCFFGPGVTWRLSPGLKQADLPRGPAPVLLQGVHRRHQRHRVPSPLRRGGHFRDRSRLDRGRRVASCSPPDKWLRPSSPLSLIDVFSLIPFCSSIDEKNSVLVLRCCNDLLYTQSLAKLLLHFTSRLSGFLSQLPSGCVFFGWLRPLRLSEIYPEF